MTHRAAMSSSHGTGDINLASALMAVGIAPDDHAPCSLISKGAKDYCRFFVQPISNCGKFETMKLMTFWTDPTQLPAHNHPFGWIMDFIRARPQGCHSPSDWLDYAHDHLTALGELPAGFPRRMDDIPEIAAKHPESRASYVLAFVHCREFCVTLARNARRQVMMTSRDGKSHQIIDTRLPLHQRRNLIARLDG